MLSPNHVHTWKYIIQSGAHEGQCISVLERESDYLELCQEPDSFLHLFQ